MHKECTRVQRISQELQKKIAKILQHKINDPRIKMVSISYVEVSRDLAYAKIFVSFLNLNDNCDLDLIDKNIKIMNGYMSKYIRYMLSKMMILRLVPELTFLYDKGLIESMRINNLIDFAINNIK
uniref:Ribosome-binding factor A n=1 Tax=Candidatus Aschnera chinzeii TaxID=1485666 RepID=A0AAT9G3P9_9ENTR|nr:MAG: 30S ribosome-binding factor RbfA [Candidatus Aschnera chinzeii]